MFNEALFIWLDWVEERQNQEHVHRENVEEVFDDKISFSYRIYEKLFIGDVQGK